jgi:hypothetical protein
MLVKRLDQKAEEKILVSPKTFVNTFSTKLVEFTIEVKLRLVHEFVEKLDTTV